MFSSVFTYRLKDKPCPNLHSFSQGNDGKQENDKAKPRNAKRAAKGTTKTPRRKTSTLADIIDIPTPDTRPLKCYAFDPSHGKFFGNEMTLGVKYEKLLPGPMGERIAVIDYDGANKRFYKPVDLDDPSLLISSGLNPTESDPRFHQQMVYAVAMETIQNFESALGRRIRWRLDERIPDENGKIAPGARARRYLSFELVSTCDDFCQRSLFTFGQGNSIWLLSCQ